MRIWLTRSFKPFEFTNKAEKTLKFKELEHLGLYVHIPFCRSLCSFCPYCKEIYNEALAKRYKEALIKEIELVGQKLSKPKEVTSLYFGGGTPALMLESLGEIIETLKQYFIIREGIGVELHPNDVTDECLAHLKKIGVTMISIGIQSFDETCIKALGRKKPHDQRIFEAIRKANFDVVDMDLIFAIPGQTSESLKRDIKTAFKNGATQISTYPFIDFTFANNRYKPLSENTKKKMLSEIATYCEENQYVRTSVGTFSKPHTEKYSSITRDNFLGFGVSATTLLRKQFKINTFSIEDYIKRVERNQLPTSLTLRFSLRQRAVYYLFWSAYSMQIDVRQFEKFFGISLERLYGFELGVARLLGFVKKDGQIYSLTKRGAYYYHYVEQAYTTAYIDKMWNVSRRISFPEKIILK